MKPAIFEMLQAFVTRQPWKQFASILSIELEDGSGRNYNVTGYLSDGTSVTRFISFK